MDNLTKAPLFFNRKGKIDVTVLDVITPSHFIVKESPSLRMSKEAASFINLEERINDYYNFVEKEHFHVPEKDEVVVVLPEGAAKYHRAQVKCILDTTKGPVYSVFLLDYGKTCKIKRDRIFKIQNDFLLVPFQAVHFHLLGIEPLSLIVNPMDLSMSYGPSGEWDDSAMQYVQKMWKDSTGTQVEVVAYDRMHELHGLLHIQTSSDYECFNDLLTQQNYAYFSEEAADKVLNSDGNPKVPSYEEAQSDASKSETREELLALWRDAALKILNAPKCSNKPAKDNLVNQSDGSLQSCKSPSESTVSAIQTESRRSSHPAVHKQERSETHKSIDQLHFTTPLTHRNVSNRYSPVQCMGGVKKVETSVETTDEKFHYRNAKELCPMGTSHKPSVSQNLSTTDCRTSNCSVTPNLYQHTDIREKLSSTPSSSSAHKTASILKNALKKAAQTKASKTSAEIADLTKQERQSSLDASPKVCTSVEVSASVKNTGSLSPSPKQGASDSSEPNTSPIYKYVRLYRSAVMKPKTATCETMIKTNIIKNEMVKSPESGALSDQSNELSLTSCEEQKLNNTVVTDKCSGVNIISAASSTCADTNSSSEFLKSTSASKPKVSVVRNFFKNVVPKAIAASPTSNLSPPQTEKDKCDKEPCLAAGSSSHGELLLSGDKYVKADEQLETTSQLTHDKNPTVSPVGIVRSIGRGVPVSKTVDEKTSPVSVTTHLQPKICAKSEPSVTGRTSESSSKENVSGNCIHRGSSPKAVQSCPKETEDKNSDFQQFVKKLEASSGNDSQTEISISDLDLHDGSDEVVIDEKENYFSDFLSKKLSKSSSVPEGSTIDPYFKTDLV